MTGTRSGGMFQGTIHCSKFPLSVGSNLHFGYCCSVCLGPGSRPSELGFNMGNQLGDSDVLQMAEGVHM